MKLNIYKKDGKIYECVLLRHKHKEKYSFINLSKRHICKCSFNTIEDALNELRERKDVMKYIITDWQRD